MYLWPQESPHRKQGPARYKTKSAQWGDKSENPDMQPGQAGGADDKERTGKQDDACHKGSC